MSRQILTIIGLLICAESIGQQKYDSLSVRADSALLHSFWTEFKQAINNRDKVKLSGLCHFPFNCDYCILDTSKPSNKHYIKVTKTLFDKSQYKIFFADRLIKEINRHNDIPISQPDFDSSDKRRYYSISYIAREENKQHPGQQHFFDIQKINGQFKIISAWTLP